jgi:cytochrome c biogenesis protein CcmG, thiol:disulfide interchange protein DsbE
MVSVKAERVLQFAIAIALGLLVWFTAGMFRERVVVAGDRAPNFEIRTEDGRTLTRSSFGGKLLVLHFWATWCPPCVTEMPSLNTFQKQFASQGVVVLGVSVDQNAKAYQNFLRKLNVSFATGRDPEARISSKYGTFQFPETYIINQDGTVVEKVISNADWMDPERVNVIKSLLAS